MPATAAYSMESLFKYPYIVDRISQVGATSLALSNYYGMGVRVSGGTEGQLVSGSKRSELSDIVYDVFNNTRLTNTMRPKGTGPHTVKPQRTGQITAHGMRFYENRLFDANEVAQYRALGSNRTDMLDRMGAEYVTRQFDDLIRRGMNGREFCFVNLLKGGFKVIQIGDDQWLPVPSSYSSANVLFENDYQLPAAHQGQLNIGGSNLISATWATTTTDIIGDIRNIRAAAVERSGLPITELWCNSKVMNYIVNNEKAQAQGGSSFMVWDRLTQQTVDQGNHQVPSSPGSKYIIDLKLRALPEVTIHVYDDGLTLPGDVANGYHPEDEIPNDVSSTNQQFVKFLGDTEVLLTPPPSTASQWVDMYAVRELIQRNWESPQEAVYGMAAWTRRQIDPVPAFDLRVIDNYCPALRIPTAVYNPTVVFG